MKKADKNKQKDKQLYYLECITLEGRRAEKTQNYFKQTKDHNNKSYF